MNLRSSIPMDLTNARLLVLATTVQSTTTPDTSASPEPFPISQQPRCALAALLVHTHLELHLNHALYVLQGHILTFQGPPTVVLVTQSIMEVMGRIRQLSTVVSFTACS